MTRCWFTTEISSLERTTNTAVAKLAKGIEYCLRHHLGFHLTVNFSVKDLTNNFLFTLAP